MKASPTSRPATLESGQNAPKLEKRDSLADVKERLTPDQIADAKQKFKTYDKDNSGTIDKQELRSLLVETMSKKMGEGMINRYVDMQFQMYDKDNSGSISEDEFLALFENMYINSNKGLPVNLPAPVPGAVRMPGLGSPGVRSSGNLKQ